MKESQTILETYRRLEADGGRAVLATVVDVKGSSYRLPGARMLIDETGRSVGTISGGCLEADVLTRAERVLKTGEPTVITYDTTQNDESVFGLGMGCRGVIRVLLETAQANKSLDFLRECFEQRKRGAMATLIDAPADFPLSTGAKFFFRAWSESAALTGESTDYEEDWFQKLTDDLAQISAVEQPINPNGVKIYETETGAVEFFLETVAPPVLLLLFGAGFDALPVVRFAKNLGWRVVVVDHRAAWANGERFPDADEIIVARAKDLDKQMFADDWSVAVLMTHNYERDREILRRLLNSPVKYIGALGPKTRTEKLLAEIGEKFDARQLKKLHAPVGLDIGAETPETIALSIVAEIQTVLANRDGGFLRNRTGSIYNR